MMGEWKQSRKAGRPDCPVWDTNLTVPEAFCEHKSTPVPLLCTGF